MGDALDGAEQALYNFDMMVSAFMHTCQLLMLPTTAGSG
jgi:hypothetical protein